MPTKTIWSKYYWMTIHTFAAAHPENLCEEEQTAAITWLNSTADTLPCKGCSAHMKEYIKENPLEEAVKTKLGLEYWCYKFHKNVREITKSKSYDPTFEEVRNAYSPYKQWPGMKDNPIPSEIHHKEESKPSKKSFITVLYIIMILIGIASVIANVYLLCRNRKPIKK